MEFLNHCYLEHQHAYQKERVAGIRMKSIQTLVLTVNNLEVEAALANLCMTPSISADSQPPGDILATVLSLALMSNDFVSLSWPN